MNQARGQRASTRNRASSKPNIQAGIRASRQPSLCAGCQSRRDRFQLVCDLPSLPRSSSSEVRPKCVSQHFNSLLSRLSVSVVILLRLVDVVNAEKKKKSVEVEVEVEVEPLLPPFTALPLSASLTTSLRLHLHLQSTTQQLPPQPQQRRHHRRQRQRRHQHGCQDPAPMGLTAVNYGVHPALAPLPKKSTQTHVQG
ncbi:hypothetical protein GTR04_7353 [Trichophyton interdigitale]|nr:hypothetical protein GTR04_7353 [Trichophyton interdigitale]